MTDRTDKWYRSDWHKVVNLLHNAALAQQRGYAVLTVNVLVGRDGNPVLLDGEPLIWTEPKLTKLEPRREEVVALLRELADL